MAYRIAESNSFAARLEEAFRYRIENVGRASARRLANRYEKVCQRLKTMPLSYPLVDTNGADDTLRWVKIDAFIVVYRVDNAHGVVNLLDLFYASSNWRERVLS